VAEIVGQARAVGMGAAGSYSTGAAELAVANSLGVLAYAATTVADLTVVVSGRNGSGYADQAAPAVGQLDPAKAGETAVRKALLSQDPRPLDPGEYTVILEPPAVADMLTFLGFLGFSAQAVQEGRSFMAGKIGTKIMGDNVTIWDDGTDPEGRPVPFDFEGIPKRKVMLIENGVARGVVHDSSTAAREGVQDTGHALPAPNVYGPLPLNLFLAPGDSSVDEMVASTGRGVLVTRFHYTNPVHPIRAVITGMTRDGTYLVEDGRISRPVVNMRFTDSLIRALSCVTAIGRERKLQAGFLGGALVPAIRVEGFAFTGATES
jgi:predicted Zn-dependent protease